MASVCKVGMGYNESQKKRGYGAKVGACAGLAAGLVRAYIKRDMLNQMNDMYISAGHSVKGRKGGTDCRRWCCNRYSYRSWCSCR